MLQQLPAVDRFLDATVIEVADDRIVADTVLCGGRWPAGLMAEMEAADA